MSALSRFVVILHEPQKLVNVALVVRAMKNMGLEKLRIVRCREPFDPDRLEGIAHDTHDVVAATKLYESLDEALANVSLVVGTSARRRASRIRWWMPADAAVHLLEQAPTTAVALLFGPEDRGLSNPELDRCHTVISIPTEPGHPSLNLGHAALLVFYEIRNAAVRAGQAELPDLTQKKRRQCPPATAAERESFFQLWEDALETIDFFQDVDATTKMRYFRSIFQRIDLDQRELGLLRSVAYEITHYARRVRSGPPNKSGADGAD